MVWRMYPNRPVFVDGRADVYGDDLIDEFLKTCKGDQKWRETLARYDIHTVLIEPGQALATILRDDHSWRKVYEDKQAVIFAREQ